MRPSVQFLIKRPDFLEPHQSADLLVGISVSKDDEAVCIIFLPFSLTLAHVICNPKFSLLLQAPKFIKIGDWKYSRAESGFDGYVRCRAEVNEGSDSYSLSFMVSGYYDTMLLRQLVLLSQGPTFPARPVRFVTWISLYILIFFFTSATGFLFPLALLLLVWLFWRRMTWKGVVRLLLFYRNSVRMFAVRVLESLTEKVSGRSDLPLLGGEELPSRLAELESLLAGIKNPSDISGQLGLSTSQEDAKEIKRNLHATQRNALEMCSSLLMKLLPVEEHFSATSGMDCQVSDSAVKEPSTAEATVKHFGSPLPRRMQ